MTGWIYKYCFFIIISFTSFYLLHFFCFSSQKGSQRTLVHQKPISGLHNQNIYRLEQFFPLCLSTAQRPPSRRCLLEACSSWPASSCAQAEFSPTTHIMKIKTCGNGPDRYCCLHSVQITRVAVRFNTTQRNDHIVITGCRDESWLYRWRDCKQWYGEDWSN